MTELQKLHTWIHWNLVKSSLKRSIFDESKFIRLLWTCSRFGLSPFWPVAVLTIPRFNLLHTAITFHHFSLFHSELKTYVFRKSYLHLSLFLSVRLISLLYRPFTWLICSSVVCFSSIFSVSVIPTCGRLSWPDLWSTFGRIIKQWLIDWFATLCCCTRWTQNCSDNKIFFSHEKWRFA